MTGNEPGEGRITVRSLVAGTLLAGVFAVLTVYFENRRDIVVTATQIAVLPYLLLIGIILAINPLLRLIRVIRPFTTVEILLIFIMGSVSAGIPTFGLASQLVPAISSVYNEHWNSEQSEWNRYVAPYIDDSFLVSEEGIYEAAQAYRDAMDARDRARLEGAPEATIDELDGVATAAREALHELEAIAFERVKEFRRRMPDHKRAYPGIIPLADESFSIYRARLKRLYHGRGALMDLRGVWQELETEGVADPTGMAAALSAAIEQLREVSALEEQELERERLDAEWQEANARSIELNESLGTMRSRQRLADIDEAKVLEDEIEKLNAELRKVERAKREATQRREQVQIQIGLTEKVREVIAALEELRGELQAGTVEAEPARRRLQALMQEFRYFDASLARFLVGDVPWSVWLRPLTNWGLLIALTYLLLMTFNILIFRQWAYNERLIYPLAKLPEILAGAEDKGPGMDHLRLPAVFRSGLFWIGFSISAGFVGFNLLAHAGWIALPPLQMTIKWQPYIDGTAFAPLLPGAKLGIFFTMIGLAFLIPAEISFSLWFFWLLYMAQLLIVVWTGHGVNEKSFPSDWWYTLNFRNAEAGGALMVFSGVVLYKCRHFIFCVFGSREVAALDGPVRKELRISSGLFLGSSVALVLMLWLGLGANLFYSIVLYLFVLILTIGLVRAVTEGGVLGFQAWISPFHFVRSLFGFDTAATAPGLFAPLMVFYSILFLDIKTFIAPAMANSLKIRDDLKMKRLRFHVGVILGIGMTVVISVLVHVMMGYAKGADAMSNWFYQGFPRDMYDNIATMAKSQPVDQTANNLWIGFGALLMVALLYFRQILFWLPHPIGLIMLVNPIMGFYWFSIFVGWLGKFLVTRYGNKGTYQSVRNIFIGLIVGELIIVALALILSVTLEVRIPIDLNRNP